VKIIKRPALLTARKLTAKTLDNELQADEEQRGPWSSPNLHAAQKYQKKINLIKRKN